MNEDLMFITLDYYVKVVGKDAEEGTLEKNVSNAIEMLVEKYNQLHSMQYLEPDKGLNKILANKEAMKIIE